MGTDLKEQKLINSTLRYMLFLTLCLFCGMQQCLNRTLSSTNDSLINVIASRDTILLKYKEWKVVKNNENNKNINKFLLNEKSERIKSFKNRK